MPHQKPPQNETLRALADVDTTVSTTGLGGLREKGALAAPDPAPDEPRGEVVHRRLVATFPVHVLSPSDVGDRARQQTTSYFSADHTFEIGELSPRVMSARDQVELWGATVSVYAVSDSP